jgi:hypothetical protein
MAKHHRHAPLYGVPEHPAGIFAAHSAHIDERVKHDLTMLTHHKSGVTERILTHHRHHR